MSGGVGALTGAIPSGRPNPPPSVNSKLWPLPDPGDQPARPQRDYPKYEPLHRDRKQGAHPRTDRSTRPERPDRSFDEAPSVVSHEAGMIRLMMNMGRDHNIGPGDVVGVILGAAKIPKECIGAIKLLPKQTLVDVADEQATFVVKKLNGIKFKGRKLAIHPAA